MYDLIYVGDEQYTLAQTELRERFPDAILEDASDYIHEGRFSIEVDVPTEEYRQAILDLGLAMISFDFQLFMMQKPKEALALLEQWKEAKNER